MKNEDKPFDDDIVEKDILPSYAHDFDFDMFLISAAVLPGYQGKGIGTELMKKYFEVMRDKIKNGCRIKNAYAYAYTGAGENILVKAGFSEIKNIIHPEKKTGVKFMGYCFGNL